MGTMSGASWPPGDKRSVHRRFGVRRRPEAQRTVRLWLMDGGTEPVVETADRQRAEELFEDSKGWPNAAAAELVGSDDDVLDRW